MLLLLHKSLFITTLFTNKLIISCKPKITKEKKAKQKICQTDNAIFILLIIACEKAIVKQINEKLKKIKDNI